MFDTLKRWLNTDAPVAHAEIDPQIAAAALLVEAALSDGIYADVEEEKIREILKSSFELADADAARILSAAEELAEDAADHHRFTKVVKACMPKADRIALVENLWLVALADGEKSAFEESFIRRVAPLLAVDDRERVFARSRAEAAARKR